MSPVPRTISVLSAGDVLRRPGTLFVRRVVGSAAPDLCAGRVILELTAPAP